MNGYRQDNTIRRVMVGTDRSKTAEHAVQWAAEFADHYGGRAVCGAGDCAAPPGHHGIQRYGSTDGRRLALSATAAASVLSSGLTAMSGTVADWIPATFGIVAGLLTLGWVFELMRGR